MKISDAAAAAAIEPATLRYYESVGVLPEPARSPSGYRRYGEEDVALIKFVRRLRSLELPLDDIRQIVDLRRRGEAPCTAVRSAMRREAAAVDERMAELKRIRTELKALIVAADAIEDEWPNACVCHVVEGSES